MPRGKPKIIRPRSAYRQHMPPVLKEDVTALITNNPQGLTRKQVIAHFNYRHYQVWAIMKALQRQKVIVAYSQKGPNSGRWLRLWVIRTPQVMANLEEAKLIAKKKAADCVKAKAEAKLRRKIDYAKAKILTMLSSAVDGRMRRCVLKGHSAAQFPVALNELTQEGKVLHVYVKSGRQGPALHFVALKENVCEGSGGKGVS